jgi:hypothetical protein
MAGSDSANQFPIDGSPLNLLGRSLRALQEMEWECYNAGWGCYECPSCGGVDPSRSGFWGSIKRPVGHVEGCELRSILDDAKTIGDRLVSRVPPMELCSFG